MEDKDKDGIPSSIQLEMLQMQDKMRGLSGEQLGRALSLWQQLRELLGPTGSQAPDMRQDEFPRVADQLQTQQQSLSSSTDNQELAASGKSISVGNELTKPPLHPLVEIPDLSGEKNAILCCSKLLDAQPEATMVDAEVSYSAVIPSEPLLDKFQRTNERDNGDPTAGNVVSEKPEQFFSCKPVESTPSCSLKDLPGRGVESASLGEPHVFKCAPQSPPPATLVTGSGASAAAAAATSSSSCGNAVPNATMVARKPGEKRHQHDNGSVCGHGRRKANMRPEGGPRTSQRLKKRGRPSTVESQTKASKMELPRTRQDQSMTANQKASRSRRSRRCRQEDNQPHSGNAPVVRVTAGGPQHTRKANQQTSNSASDRQSGKAQIETSGPQDHTQQGLQHQPSGTGNECKRGTRQHKNSDRATRRSVMHERETGILDALKADTESAPQEVRTRHRRRASDRFSKIMQCIHSAKGYVVDGDDEAEKRSKVKRRKVNVPQATGKDKKEHSAQKGRPKKLKCSPNEDKLRKGDELMEKTNEIKEETNQNHDGVELPLPASPGKKDDEALGNLSKDKLHSLKLESSLSGEPVGKSTTLETRECNAGVSESKDQLSTNTQEALLDDIKTEQSRGCRQVATTCGQSPSQGSPVKTLLASNIATRKSLRKPGSEKENTNEHKSAESEKCAKDIEPCRSRPRRGSKANLTVSTEALVESTNSSEQSCKDSVLPGSSTELKVEGVAEARAVSIGVADDEEATVITKVKEETTDGESLQCTECGKSLSTKYALSVHMRIHTGKKPWQCDLCGRQFSVKVNYERHKLRHTAVRPFQCSMCSTSYYEQRHLKAHMEKHEKFGDSFPPRTQMAKFGNYCRSTICETCGKDLKVWARLEVHLRTHTGEKPYTCQGCGRQFSVKSNYRQHIQRRHPHQLLGCPRCSRKFFEKFRLAAHAQKCHPGITQEELEQCQAVVKQEPDKHWTCDVCDMIYHSYEAWYVHIQSHKDKRYKCPSCDKTFYWLCKLEEHKRSHSDERPHTCSQCQQSFKNKQNLERHQDIHAGVKNYKCDQCGKTFTHATTLCSHRLVHSDTRSFVCKECGKTFRQSQNLWRHLQYHKDEKRHGCETCGKGFALKSDLKRHEKTHQKLKTLTCPVCAMCFDRKDNLRVHMVQRHVVLQPESGTRIQSGGGDGEQHRLLQEISGALGQAQSQSTSSSSSALHQAQSQSSSSSSSALHQAQSQSTGSSSSALHQAQSQSTGSSSSALHQAQSQSTSSSSSSSALQQSQSSGSDQSGQPQPVDQLNFVPLQQSNHHVTLYLEHHDIDQTSWPSGDASVLSTSQSREKTVVLVEKREGQRHVAEMIEQPNIPRAGQSARVVTATEVFRPELVVKHEEEETVQTQGKPSGPGLVPQEVTILVKQDHDQISQGQPLPSNHRFVLFQQTTEPEAVSVQSMDCEENVPSHPDRNTVQVLEHPLGQPQTIFLQQVSGKFGDTGMDCGHDVIIQEVSSAAEMFEAEVEVQSEPHGAQLGGPRQMPSDIKEVEAVFDERGHLRLVGKRVIHVSDGDAQQLLDERADDDDERAAEQEQMLVEEQGHQFVNEQVAQLVEGQADQLLDDQAAQLVGDQAAQLVDDQAAQLVDDQATQLVDDQATQLVDDQAAQLVDDQAAQPVDGQTNHLLDDQVIEEHAEPLFDEQADPLGDEEHHVTHLEGLQSMFDEGTNCNYVFHCTQCVEQFRTLAEVLEHQCTLAAADVIQEVT